MKNILREEINRNRELMGTINESQLLLEKPLSRNQRMMFWDCAVWGGSFWCANGADECAKVLESGTDCECNPDSGGCGDKVVTPKGVDIKLDMDKETVNEELLVEGKKFWRQLNACRDEIANGNNCGEEQHYDNDPACDGDGPKCYKFRRNYG